MTEIVIKKLHLFQHPATKTQHLQCPAEITILYSEGRMEPI